MRLGSLMPFRGVSYDGRRNQDLSSFSMMDLFRTEAEAQTAILNEGLLEIEKDPTSKQWLERLMRAAHSVKGPPGSWG